MRPRRGAGTPAAELARLKRETRAAMIDQLDVLLASTTEMLGSTPEQPRHGPVLDDIVLRQMVGYGFAVRLEVRHPQEGGRVAETGPGLSSPGPLLVSDA